MKGKKTKPSKISKKDFEIKQLKKDVDSFKQMVEQQRLIINQLIGKNPKVEDVKTVNYIPSYVM